ncbi:DUF3566 domain-containing protein, partial [Frankia sp. EI5c]|uniref:DUF3566 domain-containing protein n=1 Tax=Frankia sp. EI5c TaxID=683316 RepID=UPI001F5B3273
MPAERRPTPEPGRPASPAARPAAASVASPAAAAATRAAPTDRTAPYDRPGTPPGPAPAPGSLGSKSLSTEPLGPVDAPSPSRPGPLGPPGPQPGPRGPGRDGRDHGFEPARDGAPATGPRRAPGGGRRARLRLSRVEPLSVTRLSFAFSLCAFLIMMVAVAVVWFVLNSIGVFDSVTEAADSFTDGTNTNV